MFLNPLPFNRWLLPGSFFHDRWYWRSCVRHQLIDQISVSGFWQSWTIFDLSCNRSPLYLIYVSHDQALYDLMNIFHSPTLNQRILHIELLYPFILSEYLSTNKYIKVRKIVRKGPMNTYTNLNSGNGNRKLACSEHGWWPRTHTLATRCQSLQPSPSEPLNVNILLRGLDPRVTFAPTNTPITLPWQLLAVRHLLLAFRMITAAAPRMGDFIILFRSSNFFLRTIVSLYLLFAFVDWYCVSEFVTFVVIASVCM